MWLTWFISQAPRLETLDFRFRPLAPHALAWSCDAELAVALDDALHVFLPNYPNGGAGDDALDGDQMHHQFSMSLQASGIIRPDASINAKLCEAAGVKLPGPRNMEVSAFCGVGRGPVTGSGAALGQIVRVEWSPNGMGQNLRPVLTVLVTNGSIVTLGEHIGSGSTIASSATTRTFRNWRFLWGLGALLPIPDGDCKRGFREMDERIVSFSWAREILPGRGLLAYANDSREIVIMSVQLYSRESELEGSTGDQSAWEICELARFDGRGPHKGWEPEDPDFVPNGSGFSLKWSPWHVSPESRTATLAYIANNHAGFRRISIHGEWEKGRDPTLRVEKTDTTAICIPLYADAFIEWEDAIWSDGDGHMARGIIATPFVPKPFQVDLCSTPSRPMASHSAGQCSSVYAEEDEASTNPITGLIIHHPDPNNKPPAPEYSLVRLSATATNQDWYQTNVSENDAPIPRWAEYVRRHSTRLVPRLAAMEGFESDSDSEDLDDEFMEDDVHMSQVHPHRFRFWGLASSPGDGCTAVLMTKHNTQHPYRRPRSKILFGRPDAAKETTPGKQKGVAKNLTTEGRLWEACYGNQGDVSDIAPTGTGDSLIDQNPLRDLFKDVIAQQRCVYCESRLNISSQESMCENGHSFATCAATGLPIMAPGVSRLCAVCGLRCLKVSELPAIADRYIGSNAVVDSAGDVCGGCGGKFVS
ncbi:Uncharacterized protein TCAP_05874 [Tolypocladium capitatum]|uniref:Uncharacterized protein n=1 Tax=Tolypocladium capitatum TaxID=45235 RepID=A0A2K3Q9D0_9HYPO|nr:Uncharacterized protein TCAP_05874 [Tolypocladium capitatum]